MLNPNFAVMKLPDALVFGRQTLENQTDLVVKGFKNV